MGNLWIDIADTDLPDGCQQIEVKYSNNTISSLCSCDYWWDIHMGKEKPIYWRYEYEE